MFWRRNRPRPVYAPKIRVSRGEPLSIWERYLERGLYHFERDEYDDALADLDAAIDKNGRNGELYATRGMVKLEMGDVDEATADFDTALQLDSKQWVVHYLRGLHHYRIKAYTTAIEHLTEALRYAPMRPEALYVRGMAYYARGEVERARDEVQKAVDNADDPRAKALRPMKKFLTQLKREAKDKAK
jgi:tetratricopeptide (TPR) repeat protein